jgi:hypothetical protein
MALVALAIGLRLVSIFQLSWDPSLMLLAAYFLMPSSICVGIILGMLHGPAWQVSLAMLLLGVALWIIFGLLLKQSLQRLH